MDKVLTKPHISFEIFPPSNNVQNTKIYQTVQALGDLRPEFISVTCNNKRLNFKDSTLRIASYIEKELQIPGVVHLTARYFDKGQIDYILAKLKRVGIHNILVLRGDLVPGREPKNDFKYATDLIDYIKQKDNSFKIFGACYPEGHPESPDKVTDIRRLQTKVAAGCDCLITQMFFSNDTFYQFRENCALANIDVPILAGIMPIVNRSQALHVIQNSASYLPKKFIAMLNRYQTDPAALKATGLAYAINQIVDLVTQDVDGVHLYTMNHPDVARHIYQETETLFAI
ncbi:methylenetetrahydrofolate reductase [NAD(P)H] [Liquorilactobacillus mali]|uniref:Methylenetetrahydrofolate reductase n=1 Tax=Liquorilactobacillus mali KCTC 3596 = DSM 20444 TaxID=1046596 RepID=J1F3I6_9LACO|nr:methylenetetrahydrofolate reductase [NAD(P)H] [Liquorilactobacillus mali]EJE99979.1 5,10-methylenetetrahydrofolate reductase [Liquorilactobacillus mali KCTC 3596 = DSM 20444]KRN08682.1 5,10-methylenetetrahydrofolate reductase [Liquorilactobacillus mali KCTC 3596 = DSM 20444]MDC7954045.1 methylenetetrahydrofolate reductase [NAD(P)H] [Liquorilactobacillus mali]QFQ75441.1 methylenetetrahydrofolate reductase [NAD(P)H] [Liquorilactobacillus mali]